MALHDDNLRNWIRITPIESDQAGYIAALRLTLRTLPYALVQLKGNHRLRVIFVCAISWSMLSNGKQKELLRACSNLCSDLDQTFDKIVETAIPYFEAPSIEKLEKYIDSILVRVRSDSLMYGMEDNYVRELGNDLRLTSPTREVIFRPLWSEKIPALWARQWEDTKERLLSENSSWSFWIRWFESRLRGTQTFGLEARISRKFDQSIADFLASSRKVTLATTTSALDSILQELQQQYATQPLEDLSIEGQNPIALNFTSDGPGPVDFDQMSGVADLALDAEAVDRHAETLRLATELCNAYDRDGPGANAMKPLIDKVQILKDALGIGVSNMRPGLLMPRGEALRQLRAGQISRDADSDVPAIPTSMLEALNTLVSSYNAMVALDPSLARRDQAMVGPDSQVMVSPREAVLVAISAQDMSAATERARQAIEEEAAVSPDEAVLSSRLSRRLTESARNLARALLSKVYGLAVAIWTGRKSIAWVTAGGATSAVFAAKWAIANESWLIRTFADNPAMSETIVRILKIIKDLPLS